MEITLKLFATLTDLLPPERNGRVRERNALALEVADDITVERVIEQFNVPPRMAHLVLVNGVFVPRSEQRTRAVAEGDVVAIWPPVAGG